MKRGPILPQIAEFISTVEDALGGVLLLLQEEDKGRDRSVNSLHSNALCETIC